MYWFLALRPARKMKTMWRARERRARRKRGGIQQSENAELSSVWPRLASLRATRHQTSWQGQPTPAEMSQCRGGDTGHADFLFNLHLFRERAPNMQPQAIITIVLLSTAAAGGYLPQSSQYHSCARSESITHSFLNQISTKAKRGGFEPASVQLQTTRAGWTWFP